MKVESAKKKKDMTSDENEEKGKNTVVVGVRLDAQSKELLTWALVKVAEPGDRVVALHVLAKSNRFSDPSGDSASSMVSIVKGFDSVLAVYEGFCNLKQIDLKLKICRGSSIRKVLVREAKEFGATKLVLGVTNNSGIIGSFSTSIAKHCAKKLPRECWVAAVNSGKIVFQREAKVNNKEKNSKLLNGGDGDSYCLLPNRGDGTDFGACKDSELASSSDSPRKSCSICFSIVDTAPDCVEEENSLALVSAEDRDSSPTVISPVAPESPQIGHSWRLIRKMLPHINRNSSLEKSKTSVASWAMLLPTRYSSSTAIYPDRKMEKLDKNALSITESDSSTSETAVEIVEEEETPALPKELESLCKKYASTCRLFTYKELAIATDNFSNVNLVGKGGNSHVYKGQLSDGKEVAVKILKQSEDLLKEFVLEIEIITSLCHTNILSLIGFCFENVKLLLVYDFLSRGSLEQNLHDNANHLGWAERYKVAIGVAEALDYLHSSGSGQPIIHRDVKSSNILLSDDFKPQLSDFGFATWASSTSAHITCSDVAGTFGYLAPEYFIFGKVNEKIDVYAFGVVLLELLSGRKPIANEYPKDQSSLVMWAKPILRSGKSKQLLDSSLGSEYDNAQLERMIVAASLCIRSSPKLRPKMALVLKLLRGDDDTMKWARLQLSSSEEIEDLDEEAVGYPAISDIQSHLSLALLDVEDDMFSASSTSYSVGYITAHTSMEAYFQDRWSHSSSFD